VDKKPPAWNFAKRNPGKGFQLILLTAACLSEGGRQPFFLITDPAAWQVFF
jgi:hypothetical protein